MKKYSTLQLLGLIFGITFSLEIVTASFTGLSGKSLVRIAILGLLFVFTIKGSRFARYALILLYGLGGVVALFSAVTGDFPAPLFVLFLINGLFGVASAVFFFRSNLLRQASSAQRATQSGE